MNIFVTGANGFVGLALCHRLVTEGYKVTGGVRGDFPLSHGIKKSIIGDVSENTNLEKILKCHDIVIHLAGKANLSDGKSPNIFTEYRKINVDGSCNLVRQAATAGVKRFIFISSVKVCGDETALGHPFTETCAPNPADPYSVSKLEAEKALTALTKGCTMELVVIRPPLVYGPGVKANFLRIMHWLYKGVPLPFGAVQNKRSFISLDNLIDFIVTCIEYPSPANEIFLVSDGEDLSTTELLQRLGQAMGKPARLLPVPDVILAAGLRLIGKKNLADRLCGSLQVDISKARELLGWQPPITVDQGLRKTAQWFLSARDKRS